MNVFLPAVTHATREAQDLLRDPTQFKWYAVFLLVMVMYVYAVEIGRRRWDIVLGGAAFWLADWFNELANSVVLGLSDRAALWTTTGDSAYQILIGLNFEISCMFAISGIVYLRTLPADRVVRILGIPNRLAVAIGLSAFAVITEVLLHETGAFHWEYWWWNVPFVPLIFLFGYLWFFWVAWTVFDMPDNRRRVRAVTAFAAVDIVFAVILGAAGWL